MKYKLVLFDFDGTLADSFPWVMELTDELAVKHHFPRIPPAEWDTLRGYSARQLVNHLKIPAWKIPRLANDFRKAMARDIERIHLFPGIRELLARLAQKGVRLAIASSNARQNIQRVLGAQAALIDYYACGISLWGKTARLRGVLRQSKIPAAAALFIGDEIRDLEAARQVPLDFGAVTWGYTQADALRRWGATTIFNTVSEILPRVEGGE